MATTPARPPSAAREPDDAPGGRSPYRLGRGVTLLEQDGVARLLDLERGRFYTLNPTGSHLLLLALRAGPDRAVRVTAGEHGVDEDRVRADWVRLLAALRRKGLVLGGPAAGRTPPGRLHCWLLLTLAWASIRLLGWNRTVRLWRGRSRPAAGPWRDDLAPPVGRFDADVRAAAATHPLSPQCKERALVAWHVLRNSWGLPAELVIGVLAFPFEAHAWVECGPLTVTDDRARCDRYVPAARYQ